MSNFYVGEMEKVAGGYGFVAKGAYADVPKHVIDGGSWTATANAMHEAKSAWEKKTLPILDEHHKATQAYHAASKAGDRSAEQHHSQRIDQLERSIHETGEPSNISLAKRINLHMQKGKEAAVEGNIDQAHHHISRAKFLVDQTNRW